MDVEPKKVEKEIQNLLDKGELYENVTDHYRTS